MKRLVIAIALLGALAGRSFAEDRKQDYISAARAHATQLLSSYKALKTMQLEWNALDYGNTLPDGAGRHLGITKAEVGSVVFDTTNAIETLMSGGHATNLHKIAGQGPDQ